MRKNRLQEFRQAYIPDLPSLLSDPSHVLWKKADEPPSEDPKICSLFPHLAGRPLLQAEKAKRGASAAALRIGVVLSGGQASGGHNVIVGIHDCIKKLSPGSKLYGFLDGPGGIVAGKYRELTSELLDPYRNQGGFDMIGSGRVKIETQEQLSAALSAIQKISLDGLVVIGGDDSNTNAALLAEYLLQNGCRTNVIGVPKTIDGDLKNSYVATSFGFDTACKVYAEMIGNIARDASSAKKYTHFIRLMGRSASHIALECAFATQPNLTLIGEEVAAGKMTLSQIVAQIADLVCARAELGKQYGVILIPEGLIEFIPEIATLIKELNALLAADPSMTPVSAAGKLTTASQKCFEALPSNIRQQLLLHRDPHGNVQVSLIETERLLIDLVEKELQRREKAGTSKAKFSPVQHFFGYEGRAGFPSNFDCNYCYALGFASALLIQEGATGYMATVSNLHLPACTWGIGGVPLTSLMHVEVRKGKEKPVIQKALVDLSGNPFRTFQRLRDAWKLDDLYLYPGPIQFYGDPSLTQTLPMTLLLET
jgi:diphosphate-dependent phosphofructokinase